MSGQGPQNNMPGSRLETAVITIEGRRAKRPEQVAARTKNILVKRLFRVRVIGKRETYEMRAGSGAEAIAAVAIAHDFNVADLEAEAW